MPSLLLSKIKNVEFIGQLDRASTLNTHARAYVHVSTVQPRYHVASPPHPPIFRSVLRVGSWDDLESDRIRYTVFLDFHTQWRSSR
jgi:hypothetical protein